MSESILRQTAHRPWPLPDRPWVMRMSWEHLAFMHWRVSPDWLAARLPRGLEVDCHEGSAWLGVVPFFMTHVRPRGLPGLPTTRNFLELNLRTYVTREGRAGVWFFSLDADSWLSVRGARMGFHLPYFDADMDASVTSDVAYRSERVHAGASPGRFRAVYRPDGGVFRSRPGSLEHWLTERYRLYATRADGTLYRGEIHHRPWPLQSAVAEVRENTLGVLIEAEMGLNPEHVMFARSLDVVAWALHRC